MPLNHVFEKNCSLSIVMIRGLTYINLDQVIVAIVAINVIAMVQLASKFKARIGQNAYLTRFFARHKELHAFDTRVSRLLAYATMLASYAARDLYALTRISTRDRFPVHANLLMSHFTQ